VNVPSAGAGSLTGIESRTSCGGQAPRNGAQSHDSTNSAANTACKHGAGYEASRRFAAVTPFPMGWRHSHEHLPVDEILRTGVRFGEEKRFEIAVGAALLERRPQAAERRNHLRGIYRPGFSLDLAMMSYTGLLSA